MSGKLSERTDVSMTYEMGQWLDDIVREGGFRCRGAAVRSLLQTIMEDDLAAQAEDALKLVENDSSKPAPMPDGQGVGARASSDGRSGKCRALTD